MNITKTKFSTDLSNLFSIIRFPLIIGVVFIHAHVTNVGIANGKIISNIEQNTFTFLFQYYISEILARVCVPLFYIISGYLFYWNFNGLFSEYKRKIVSRIRTLLIPFLFWNLLNLGMILLGQLIPITSGYFSGIHMPTILSLNFWGIINNVFGITGYPIAYQFWFIRDLMVLILLSPILLFFIKKIPFVSILFLSIMWIFKFNWLYIPSSEAILFFMVGGFWGIKKWDIRLFDKYVKIIFLLYLIISFLDLLLVDNVNLYFYNLLHNIGIVLGIINAFCLLKSISKNNKVNKILINLSPISFFIFALHEPLLTAFRKLFYFYLNPTTSFEVLILYLGLPFFVIILCILFYKILFRSFPSLLQYICGGR